MERPYNSYSENLKNRYGYRIYRVGVDGGFSCPHRDKSRLKGGCIFCDSQGAVSVYHRKSESSYTHESSFEKDIDSQLTVNVPPLAEQAHRGVEFVRRRYKAEHFSIYFQSYSNTYAPVEVLKEKYDSVIDLYPWEELIVSTRPDCIDRQKVALLSSYKTDKRQVCVELGLQSGNDRILKAMRRGHSVKDFLDAASLVKEASLNLCVHVLTGFPGETEAELNDTIRVINTVHPQAVKIHNLNIASGTVLFEKYLEGEVTAPCTKRHLWSTVYFLRRIPSDIVIERLICETPSHRLASPRAFADKNNFLRSLEGYMVENNFKQGDLI
ncbi:MAG: TIGR01212 family radical SAM protein [Sphaerochaetaceae bacterium]|nr:TIGR01212 family radical SAM protein [Sphaerochaetaceae bacterium]